MDGEAWCIHRRFPSAGPAEFRMDRHYFVYALAGSMRLQADGRRWTLTPARGALVAAHHPVEIAILLPVTAASVLFDTGMMKPIDALRVFDVSPLCRELVRACRRWGPDDRQDDHAAMLFRALSSEVRRLSETPSPCFLPVPRSAAVAKAVAVTETAIGGEPRFEEIAVAVGQSPRTLARRFSEEMGMTWRDVLRRLRIIRAVERLSTSDASVTEVAFEVGYASLSAFNAAFRELTGVSPGTYRRGIADL